MMTEEEDVNGVAKSSMVTVKNAWKTYNGKDFILQDLNMTVVKGEIYSLLGSSGVGKTSLLQAITGIIGLDSGDIHVDIQSRLQIGYMPQELALYEELTLEETFRFFGMILYMNKKELKERVKQLIILLDLPPANTQINSLSGGEQRRISIAVAMLNNPQLLILDEPTASLDPVLKQSIWEYLIKLTTVEGKTILLTTHYIEEANNSDKVGFMNNGKIMMEGSPQQVKSSYDPPCERLEEVYHHLCEIPLRPEETAIIRQTKNAPAKSLSHFSNYSSNRVMAFGLKTLFYIRRNLLIFYVFICSPAIMAVLLTWALESPKGLKLGYINYESNCTDENINCTSPLSCRYLQKLKENEFDLVEFGSIENGKRAVKNNDVWGVVNFNWNFSDGVINRLDYFYAAEHVEISDEDEARIWLDMSAYPIGNLMKKNFYDSFLESIQEWYEDCGWNKRTAHPIIVFQDPLFGEDEKGGSLISNGIPAAIVILLFSTSIFLGLIFVITEKELGTLKRCKVNGLKTYELLISIFATDFVCLTPTGIFLLLVLYLYTGPTEGPLLWTTLLLYLQLATGILVGFVVGLLTSKLSDALQTTSGLLFAITFMEGLLWPTEGLHWIEKILHKVLPSAIPTDVFITITNRGYTNKIFIGIAHSIGWMIILILVIMFIIKRTDK